MLYVIQTGYVIKDDPMPINEEADKILRKVGGLVGVSFIGSSSGLGTRYMAFGLDVGVQSVEAEKVLSAFNALIGKLRPTNAPYTFLDGSVCGYEECKDPLFALWGGSQQVELSNSSMSKSQVRARLYLHAEALLTEIDDVRAGADFLSRHARESDDANLATFASQMLSLHSRLSYRFGELVAVLREVSDD